MTHPFRMGFVLFENLTQLDFTGPLQVLSQLPGAEVHLIAKSMAPVPTDGGLSVPPTTLMADCPDLDLICIPGGIGVEDAISDREMIDFVRRQASRATYVTSVCTGAFVLGAARLLQGKRATTHWAWHDQLTQVGAIPVRRRVVRDGKIFTGGGVTAGIDFAFTIAREIAGDTIAETLQLALEYDPMPPMYSGSPEKAGERVLAAATAHFQPHVASFSQKLAAALAG